MIHSNKKLIYSTRNNRTNLPRLSYCRSIFLILSLTCHSFTVFSYFRHDSTSISQCVERAIIINKNHGLPLVETIRQHPTNYFLRPSYLIPQYSLKNDIPQETIYIPDFFYTSHTPNAPSLRPADVLLSPLL